MEDEIKRYLKTKWIGGNIIYKTQMDSTNNFAKKVGEENVMNGTVVVTELQSAGKGRRGRSWISPKGNCYFSMLLRPEIRPENASRVTLVAALALAKVIGQMSGLQAQIKWPNDVIMNGKKVCGILTEASTMNSQLAYVVVGIGINVNQQEFDLEIRDMATSIRVQTGKNMNCAQLIAMFLNKFECYYNFFLETEDLSKLMMEYNKLLVNREKEVIIVDEEKRIRVAIGIDETGELLLKDKDGNIERVVSGEVSVRGLYGYV